VFETEQTRHLATAPRDDRKSVGMDGPDGIGRHRSKSRIPPSIPIPAASVVAAIQTPMRSFRVIEDASTTHSLTLRP
jgi:hypothetical protein